MNYKALKNYFATPRMTTDEFELSRIKCGFHYVIDSLYFDDGISKFPTWATGRVRMEQGLTKVGWNRFGECFVNGRRFDRFDLISPLRKEHFSEIFVICGMVGAAILIAILYFTR